MKKNLAVISCIICMLLLAFRKDKKVHLSIPKGWPTPVYELKNNPLSKEKILLGRALFYDPILSADSNISCSSCHLQYTAFTHVDHSLSHGINGKIGTRNSPALFNLAWAPLFMWDGAINHLDMQPLAPIAHPAEMASGIDSVLIRLRSSALYPALFNNAFGDTSISGERMLKAMSQFMLTLISSNSKYDKVMRKEKGIAFTDKEEKGHVLFQTYCAVCHKEPLFTTYGFAGNGLPVDTTLNDIGRMKITGSNTDSLHFRIPSLRNVEYSYPYMHDGRFKRLQEVIEHYNSGIVHNTSLSPELSKHVTFNSNEKVDLLAFLLTLTDKDFLYNTSFSYPKYIFSSPTKD